MINAYLFIHLNQDYTDQEIIKDIRKISKVKEAHRLYGTYDIVIYMETEDTAELKSVTLESIRSLKFVESTVTFIALDSYKKSN